MIGALIANPNQIDVVSAKLDGRDFHDQDLGNIYDAIVLRKEMGEPVGDMRLLMAALKKYALIRKDKVTVTDMAKWVRETVPTNGPWYAEVIIQAAQQRQLLVTIGKSLKGLIQKKSDANSISGELISKVDSIFTRADIKLSSLGSAALEAYGKIGSSHGKEEMMGSGTGLRALDDIIGGFMPGEVTILAARPSVGKTALAMQVCDSIAREGKSVLFVSLEMRSDELASRVMAAEANVNGHHIRLGACSQDELGRLRQASESMEGRPLWIFDPPAAGLKPIRAAIKLASWKGQLSLVCIDYLQLIRHADPRKQRYEQVSEISAGLKKIAREFKVPLLVLCQLSREAESDKPRLSHLKESGSIEQDADTVIAIWRGNTEGKTKGETDLIVLKNRHGERGTVRVIWRPEATRFEDAEPLIFD